MNIALLGPSRVMATTEFGNCVLYRSSLGGKPSKMVRLTHVNEYQAGIIMSAFLRNHAQEYVNLGVDGSDDDVEIRAMCADRTVRLEYNSKSNTLCIMTAYHRESDWSQECVDY